MKKRSAVQGVLRPKNRIASPALRVMVPPVIRHSTAPLRQLWLVVFGCAAVLLADAQAVEPYRLRSGDKKVTRLQKESSLDEHRLLPHRAPKLSPARPGKNDFPARYNRKQKGTERAPRR